MQPLVENISYGILRVLITTGVIMEHMSFHDYWRIATPADKQDLAKRLHTSASNLSQIAHGHRKPSLRMVDLARYVTGVHLEFDNCCED